jgi:hypothetical protein
MHHVTGLVTSHKIATITQFSLDNIFHASWRTMFRITLFLPLLNVYIQVFPSLAICNLYASLLVALAVPWGKERLHIVFFWRSSTHSFVVIDVDEWATITWVWREHLSNIYFPLIVQFSFLPPCELGSWVCDIFHLIVQFFF